MLRKKSVALYLSRPCYPSPFSFVVFGDSVSLRYTTRRSLSYLSHSHCICVWLSPTPPHPISHHWSSFPFSIIPIFRHYIYFSIWRCAIRLGVHTRSRRACRTVLGSCQSLPFLFFYITYLRRASQSKPPKSIVPPLFPPSHLAVHVHMSRRWASSVLLHILITGM